MRECPTDIELSRAVTAASARENDQIVDLQLEAHFLACTECRETRDGFVRAISLARELPLELPSASRREEMRTAVIAASASLGRSRPARSRARYAIAAGAFAAAAAAVFVAVPDRTSIAAAHAHGTIRGGPGARYTAISTAPNEIIRLEDGSLEVEVEPLHPGERFVVLVGDAEVEVRGTAFQVVATADRLSSVSVHHGRVEVRPRAGSPAILGARESWRAAITRTEPVPPHPEVVEPPRPAPKRRVAVTQPSPAPAAEPEPPPAPAKSTDELAYDAGWTALRAGNFARAATSFARVFILAPDGSLAEDAAFWHAVALARGKRTDEAVTAFRDFLEAHRRSSHAGEASAMLGWMLVDLGELAEAAVRFRAAANDPDPDVRKSARAGLDAVK